MADKDGSDSDCNEHVRKVANVWQRSYHLSVSLITVLTAFRAQLTAITYGGAAATWQDRD